MKSILSVLAVAVLATSFTVSAGAAAKKSDLQIACEAKAKKAYSAIHPFKRRAYIKRCMGEKT